MVGSDSDRVVEAFDYKKPWATFVQQVDGIMFTLGKDVGEDGVDIWHVKGSDTRAIFINGDKGHAAGLFGNPAILFDDNVRRIDGLLRFGVPGSEGIVVPSLTRRSHCCGKERYLFVSEQNN